MTRLSENFTLDELLRNSGASTVPAHILTNARHTAELLELIRRQLGDVPIIVTSWYRPPAKNADTLGASRSSAHLHGYGVDFKVPGMTSQQVVSKLAPHARGLPFDQLIDERNHTHVSADPRMRRLVLAEVTEGEYLPWAGAGTTTGPTVKASPEGIPHKPGTVAWWLALLAVLIPIVLNFLSKSSPPTP